MKKVSMKSLTSFLVNREWNKISFSEYLVKIGMKMRSKI